MITNELVEFDLQGSCVRGIEWKILRITENREYGLQEVLIRTRERWHERVQQRDVDAIREDVIEKRFKRRGYLRVIRRVEQLSDDSLETWISCMLALFAEMSRDPIQRIER